VLVAVATCAPYVPASASRWLRVHAGLVPKRSVRRSRREFLCGWSRISRSTLWISLELSVAA